jgi:hypothetical protein
VLTLKIRKPAWARGILTEERFREEAGFLLISRNFGQQDSFSLEFEAQPEVQVQGQGEHYYRRGPLVYALAIESEPVAGRAYLPGFQDWLYRRSDFTPWRHVPGGQMTYEDGQLWVELEQPASGRRERLPLVPLGRTALRQAAF